jgi:hypothetical protein
MSTTTTVDAARVELLLSELRLAGVKLIWAKLTDFCPHTATMPRWEVSFGSCRRFGCLGFFARGIPAALAEHPASSFLPSAD